MDESAELPEAAVCFRIMCIKCGDGTDSLRPRLKRLKHGDTVRKSRETVDEKRKE